MTLEFASGVALMNCVPSPASTTNVLFPSSLPPKIKPPCTIGVVITTVLFPPPPPTTFVAEPKTSVSSPGPPINVLLPEPPLSSLSSWPACR